MVTGRYFDEGEVTATGQRAYYARDHLGSVRDVLDVSTGSLLRSIDYYPNGKVYNSSGTFEPEFEFAGMQSFPYMASGGALLTHYRVYDPALGRWLSRDPIAEDGGINLYGYVGGNFVNLVDPLGLDMVLPLPSVGSGTAGVAATGALATTLSGIGGLIYSSPVGEGSDIVPKKEGNKGCKFVRQVYYGGECKTCMYICPGYGGPVTFGQAAGMACPGITSAGLVDTSQLDPKCSGGKKENCPK